MFPACRCWFTSMAVRCKPDSHGIRIIPVWDSLTRALLSSTWDIVSAFSDSLQTRNWPPNRPMELPGITVCWIRSWHCNGFRIILLRLAAIPAMLPSPGNRPVLPAFPPYRLRRWQKVCSAVWLGKVPQSQRPNPHIPSACSMKHMLPQLIQKRGIKL